MRHSTELRKYYTDGIAPSIAAKVLGMRRSDVIREYGMIAYGAQTVRITRSDRAAIRRECKVNRDIDGTTDQEGISLDWPPEWDETAQCLKYSSPSFTDLDEKALNRMRRSIPGGSWEFERLRTS